MHNNMAHGYRQALFFLVPPTAMSYEVEVLNGVMQLT